MPLSASPVAELRPIDSLKPYPRNARTHSEEQVAQIAASIKEFGWTTPVLVDGENGVIAGHGRLLAARKLGMAEVPVIELGRLTAAQKRAYILADNRIAESAGWDAELLAVELDELRDMQFDLGVIGFAPGELNELIGTPNTGYDPDEVPPVQAEAVSKLGDVWLLGGHRLLCGDATSESDVRTLLGDVKPLLMVTDPPYGVEYDPDWRNRAKRAGGLQAYGASSIGQVENDSRADWREAWALFPGDVAYVWHGALHATLVAESLMATEFEIRAQVIWAKQHAPISRGHYHWQHEPCWYAVRKGGTGHWAGDRKQTTLWQISNANAFGGAGDEKKAATGHGTQKPVECMRRPIENNSEHGSAVYDPFVGSGTTIIAAEQTGRRCYAMELSPQYVDVCCERWANFTGKDPVRESDGVSWNSLKVSATSTTLSA